MDNKSGNKPEQAEDIDIVNKPPHYMYGNLETIEEMELVFGPRETAVFCKITAWKYRARALYKGTPMTDMEKSYWYLNKFKELKEKADES